MVYVTPEVDSDDENVEYEDDSGHHYRLYLDELDNSSTSPSGNTSAGWCESERSRMFTVPEAAPDRVGPEHLPDAGLSVQQCDSSSFSEKSVSTLEFEFTFV